MYKDIEYHIFSIAIDKYKNHDVFYKNVENVENLITTLTSKYQFEKGNVVRLYNEKASKKNILNNIRNYVTNLSNSSCLLFIFVGHSLVDSESKKKYWLTSDSQLNDVTSYISISQIINHFEKCDGKILFMLDSFFPNSIFNKKEHFKKSKQRWVLFSGTNYFNQNDKLRMGSTLLISFFKFLTHNNRNAITLNQILNILKTRGFQYLTNLKNSTDSKSEFVFYLKNYEEKETPYFQDVTKLDEEERHWSKINNNQSIKDLKNYLEKFPKGQFKLLAENKISFLEEESDWKKMKLENSISELKKFQKKYPYGNYFNETTMKIEKLEEEELWRKIFNKNTKYLLNKYISKYPNGKFILKVEDMLEGQKIKESNGRIPKRKKKNKKRISRKQQSNFLLSKPLIAILIFAILLSFFLYLKD